GQRYYLGGGRLRVVGYVQQRQPCNACVDRGDTGDFRHLLDQGFWRAGDHGKNIRESITLVIGGAGLVERAIRAYRHKKGCNSAAATVAVPRSEATVAAMRVELLMFNLLVSDVRCGRLF